MQTQLNHKKYSHGYQFPMTSFREAAKTARSWSELATDFHMDIKTARFTCKMHGITPAFLKERVQ